MVILIPIDMSQIQIVAKSTVIDFCHKIQFAYWMCFYIKIFNKITARSYVGITTVKRICMSVHVILCGSVMFRQTVLHLWKLMWSCCKCEFYRAYSGASRWWHNSVSNHQPHHCLFNRLFRRRSIKNIRGPRHWFLCGEFTDDRWIPRTKGQ